MIYKLISNGIVVSIGTLAELAKLIDELSLEDIRLERCEDGKE